MSEGGRGEDSRIEVCMGRGDKLKLMSGRLVSL